MSLEVHNIYKYNNSTIYTWGVDEYILLPNLYILYTYIYLREIKYSPNLLENVKMYTFSLLKKVFLNFLKRRFSKMSAMQLWGS